MATVKEILSMWDRPECVVHINDEGLVTVEQGKAVDILNTTAYGNREVVAIGAWDDLLAIRVADDMITALARAIVVYWHMKASDVADMVATLKDSYRRRGLLADLKGEADHHHPENTDEGVERANKAHELYERVSML